MTDLITVQGSNGGGGGSQHTPQEAPNTLRSRAMAKALDLISAGPIAGLTTADGKAIYFNDTPLWNADATINFANTIWDIRTGTPSQTYIPGFGAVEAETAINTQVFAATPVTHTVSAINIDAARVTVRLPNGLWSQDTSSGDTNGYHVSLTIEVKATSGGTWTTAVTDTISGKTMNAYERAYRINKPVGIGAATWDIRVIRTSADETVATNKNDLWWDRYTEIQEVQLPYNNCALVGLSIDAQAVGGSIPTRSYDVAGILCQVPSNYNPTTRVYTGVWDGTFQTLWTDNPAWHLYDLLTNTKYGFGLSSSLVDRWSFYQASQYNDGLVDDGLGGTEPRYTMNVQITTQQQAWALCQSIASVMNAVLMFSGGVYILNQDRPTSVSRMITTSDVIDGDFVYSSTGLAARHTACNVTYNDASNKFLPTVAHYEDASAITRYGYNLTSVAGFGVTSKGQALRLAKWVVATETNTLQAVKFKVGFNHADIQPGDVVEVMDNNFTQTQFGCKVTSASSLTSIALDRTITLKPSVVYKADLLASDGTTIRTYTINESNGSFTAITPTVAMPEVPITGYAVIVYSTSDVVPRPFRVWTVVENQPGEYEVTAIQYDANKYALVESGIVVTPPPYVALSMDKTGPVSNIVFTTQQYSDPTFGSYVNLAITWDKPTTSFTTQYIVKWRKDNGPYSTPIYVDQPGYTITKTVPGIYDVIISAVNIKGVLSPPTSATYTYSVTGSNTLYPPINLVVKDGTGSGTEFYSTDFTFQWAANTSNAGSAVAGYQIQIYNADTSTLIYTDRVASNIFEYTYLYSLNQQNSGGPFRNLQVKIYTLDAQNLLSASALTNTFHNYAPAVPNNFTVTALSNSVMLKWDPVAGPDITGYIVWASTTSGFTPASTNVVFKGDATLTSHQNLTSGTTYYYRIATTDTFGAALDGTGLAVSSTSSAIPTRAGVPSGAAFPTTPAPVNGDVFYRTDLSHLYSYNGTSWSVVANDITANTITGAMVQAYTLTGNNVAAGTLTADKMSVTTLDAITANMGSITSGSITLNTSGFIQGGSTAYNTGSGFFLGYSGSAYKFSCGAATGAGISWDGSNFSIRNSSGTVIFGSGANLSTSNISGLGSFATLSQINSGNVSTYIANAAIQTAEIGDAQVSTLKIGANQVTVPVVSSTTGSLTLTRTVGSYQTIQSVTITNPDPVNSQPVLLQASCALDVNYTATGTGNQIDYWIMRSGSTTLAKTTYTMNAFIGDQYAGVAVVASDTIAAGATVTYVFAANPTSYGTNSTTYVSYRAFTAQLSAR